MTYEYAVQWRWQGETEWMLLQSLRPGEETARHDLERMKVNYPKAETRIVRRPVVEWEVVE